MAEHVDEPEVVVQDRESVLDKISEKIHGHDSSSSSSSESEDEKKPEVSAAAEIKSKIFRIFGREKPIHHVLGGGKPADIFLWRDKKISAGVLGGVTAIWVLFDLLDYHLLTLVCHCLILMLAILFLWSNATTFINKSPPHIPEVCIPEELTVQIALSLRYYINSGFAALREIASGRDLKKFLAVIAGMWLLSFIGSCCNFLTLFYIAFVSLHTIPLLYEKYEDQVDSFAEKATSEFKKHYAVIHAKYISKIPVASYKGKKLL